MGRSRARTNEYGASPPDGDDEKAARLQAIKDRVALLRGGAVPGEKARTQIGLPIPHGEPQSK